MRAWLAISILLVLIVTIIWPYFLIILGLVLFFLSLIYLDHIYGTPSPFWVWGQDPLHEIIVKWWDIRGRKVVLEYRNLLARDQEWIRIMDTFDPNLIDPGKIPNGLNIPVDSRHIFVIKPLSPGERYEFRITDIQSHRKVTNLKNPTFYTQKIDGNDSFRYKFAVFGDLQLDEPMGVMETFMMYLVRRKRPEFLLYLGDHVSKYYHPQLWHAFFRIMRDLFKDIPFYPAIGNHCGGDGGYTAARLFLLRPADNWNYSWNYQKIFFITVNSLPILNQDWEEVKSTERWLEDQLVNIPNDIRYVIITFHVPFVGPPYSQNGQFSFYEDYLSEHWKPLLDKYSNKISVVFSGHKHSYVREGKYIVTASIHGVRKYKEMHDDHAVVYNGHHFVMVDADEKRMLVQAIGWNRKLIDQIIISPLTSDKKSS